MIRKRIHGTVGAVALDKVGNLATATSTGGTPNSLSGRIGDSCVKGPVVTPIILRALFLELVMENYLSPM